MEMQTANDYRHMEIINDATMYRDLMRLYKTGNLNGFFSKCNEYLHKIEVPWDDVASTKTTGIDGKRWLPLVHSLLLHFEEDAGDSEKDYTKHVASRINDIWHHEKATLIIAYRSETPKSFLKKINENLHNSFIRLGHCISNLDYITVVIAILERCKTGDLNKQHDELIDLRQHLRSTLDTWGTGPCNITNDIASGNQINRIKTLEQENTSMNPIKIENRTYFDNQPAADMTDEQVFATISDLEAEGRILSALKTKSTKLTKRINALRKSAKKLAAYVDAR
jgi:hypothetical protein